MTFKINEDKDFAKSLEAFYRKRGYSDLEKARAALEGCLPAIEHAIAEAVAAERERNIGACRKIEAGYIVARMGDCATASHRCAEAIRSVAK